MAKIVIPSLPIYVLLSNIQTNKTQQAIKPSNKHNVYPPFLTRFASEILL